jgi:hypothetical protein
VVPSSCPDNSKRLRLEGTIEDKLEVRSRRLFLLYKRRSQAHAFTTRDETQAEEPTTSNTSTEATALLSHIHHEDHDLRSTLSSSITNSNPPLPLYYSTTIVN